MLTIKDPSDVDDPRLQRILQQRFEQLSVYGCAIEELTRFHLIQPGDDVSALLTSAVDGSRYGDPGFTPSWEWVEDHDGWFETPVIVSDDGFGLVYFVPDRAEIDADLLTLCRCHAIKSGGGAPNQTDL